MLAPCWPVTALGQMGAHLSTVHVQVQEQFKKRDQDSKGYLTLKEVLALRPMYSANPQHLGLLYNIDKNHDGRFTLDELLTYASFAHSYARTNQGLDSSYMAAGLCSMRMWQDLRDDSGREQFVDWTMRLFTEGFDVTHLTGTDELYVHRKALKAMHVLFDMERNLGIDYQGLRDMVQSAAEEQQLLDADNPDHDHWVPLEILRIFTESLADGMCGIMESFFSDDADAVLDSMEVSAAAVTEAALQAQAALLADNSAGPSSSRGIGGSSRQQHSARSSKGVHAKSTLGRTPHVPTAPKASSSSSGGSSRRPPVITPLKLPTKPLDM